MEPPMEYYEIVSEENEIVEEPVGDISRPLPHEVEWPGIVDKGTEHSQKPFIGYSQSVYNHCLELLLKTPIRYILQPQTIASLLAIIVGMVPVFQDFVFWHDAPRSFLTDSLDILAGAVVPSVMLVLGGMLAEGPNDSALGTTTTIGISVARLLVVPLIGIGVVALADHKVHLLIEGDQMYCFVLLLQYTTPIAILLGVIYSLRNYGVKEASTLLFWQHICASCGVSHILYCYLLQVSVPCLRSGPSNSFS